VELDPDKLRRVIPEGPGAYLFKEQAGRVIYVGKAKNLRKRVLSYFRPADDLPNKTVLMMKKAASLDYIITSTENEAFILESNLVRKHMPRYNIILRDDKRYPLLRLDLNEPQIYDGAIYYIDAYTDPENNGLGDNVGIDSLWSSIFKKLSWGDEYNLIWNYQEHRIIGIFLSQPLDDKRALAVCYRATDGVSEFDVGDYDTSLGWDKYNPRLAELICPPSDEFGPDSFSSFFPSTWKMMMRNVYELGIHDVDPVLIPDIVNIRIEDRSLRPNRSVVADPSGISYLRIFGLDSYDRQGNLKKDGRVDNIPGIIFANSGHIMFPWPEPFNPPQRVIEDILDPGDPEELLFEYDELIRNGVLYDTLVWCGNDDAAHTYSIIVEWPNVDVKDPPDR